MRVFIYHNSRTTNPINNKFISNVDTRECVLYSYLRKSQPQFYRQLFLNKQLASSKIYSFTRGSSWFRFCSFLLLLSFEWLWSRIWISFFIAEYALIILDEKRGTERAKEVKIVCGMLRTKAWKCLFVFETTNNVVRWHLKTIFLSLRWHKPHQADYILLLPSFCFVFCSANFVCLILDFNCNI